MRTPRPARLVEIDLPEFGMPATTPRIPREIYETRLHELRRRGRARGLDEIVVYADREHSANISYLTGFDPRFEEALLVVGDEGAPAILVGNECVGMARAAPLEMEVILFPPLSLPGQPDRVGGSLKDVLIQLGIGSDRRVGVIGWKELIGANKLDIPAFIADDLRDLTGSYELVENATGILINAADGMRVINEVDQLAYFEAAACHTSSGVKRLLFGVQPGMTEQEAVRLLEWNGAPLSCHLMLSSGERAALGLLSPGDHAIERGDPMTVAFGIWGALNCRAGFVVGEAAELPTPISDYVEMLVAPYFAAIVEWYEALRIGQTGGALWEIINRRLGSPFFGIFLNPGHQIHLDEWVNSPVRAESTIRLESGMALQVDVIPATSGPYFTTNIEDGVALADSSLRSEFAASYPEAWARIGARRRFMINSLGIDLHPDVLPFSNIPGYLPPFVLAPNHAMAMA